MLHPFPCHTSRFHVIQQSAQGRSARCETISRSHRVGSSPPIGKPSQRGVPPLVNLGTHHSAKPNVLAFGFCLRVVHGAGLLRPKQRTWWVHIEYASKRNSPSVNSSVIPNARTMLNSSVNAAAVFPLVRGCVYMWVTSLVRWDGCCARYFFSLPRDSEVGGWRFAGGPVEVPSGIDVPACRFGYTRGNGGKIYYLKNKTKTMGKSIMSDWSAVREIREPMLYSTTHVKELPAPTYPQQVFLTIGGVEKCGGKEISASITEKGERKKQPETSESPPPLCQSGSSCHTGHFKSLRLSNHLTWQSQLIRGDFRRRHSAGNACWGL